MRESGFVKDTVESSLKTCTVLGEKCPLCSVVEIHDHHALTEKMLVLSVKWVSLMLQCSRNSPPSCSHSDDVGVACQLLSLL